MGKRIEIKKGEIITMEELFKSKERFHKELSRLSFEEKIKILMRLWEIARPTSSGIKKVHFGDFRAANIK